MWPGDSGTFRRGAHPAGQLSRAHPCAADHPHPSILMTGEGGVPALHEPILCTGLMLGSRGTGAGLQGSQQKRNKTKIMAVTSDLMGAGKSRKRDAGWGVVTMGWGR